MLINSLQAGFARIDITPMMGIALSGYYVPRYAAGVLDALEINALALQAGGTRAVLLSIDNGGLSTDTADAFRQHIADVTGLSADAVFLSATHTHTGPFLRRDSEDPLQAEYYRMVYRKMADAARFALEDMQTAQLGLGVGSAPGIAFVRRFRMKDGSVRTNPGVHNPDILAPLGEADERVNVLRFRRARGDIALVNFGNHPDTVGGCHISADWPGFLRRTLERTLEGCRCIFFNGAQGDVNHVNVNAQDGDNNDLKPDFDDVNRGYGHARHMGNVVAGGVLQVWDKVHYTDVDTLRTATQTVCVPANRPAPEELAQARLYDRLHQEGRDDEIPFEGMQLTTAVADAARKLRLEHGPDSFSLQLAAVAIGPVALIGLPGEPFTGIGRALKESEGWALVLPCCNTNGKEGYFPMREAYDEGGYEAKSSNYRAGVAELIIKSGRALLDTLREAL